MCSVKKSDLGLETEIISDPDYGRKGKQKSNDKYLGFRPAAIFFLRKFNSSDLLNLDLENSVESEEDQDSVSPLDLGMGSILKPILLFSLHFYIN